ncbi:helix-turn-helix transcriptional regulator [Domibacillus robiginosus]|uniref:helix-turn-helix transcriptional regulator n=1 Tax=Domibacillus robiginosus TaxID=1071054 RepID=UPI00067B59D3|nr:helix-turn-helix transcriptional regulator [Domibacillus robiginosus]
MELGSWIKQEREKRDLTQAHISDGVGLSQGTVSLWENNKAVPSIVDLYKIAACFGMKSLKEIPFDQLDIQKGGGLIMESLSLYELPTCDSVKTFEGKTYELKGFMGIEKSSGEVEHVFELYYRTRTVVVNNCVVAKRKSVNDELQKVKAKKLKAKS